MHFITRDNDGWALAETPSDPRHGVLHRLDQWRRSRADWPLALRTGIVLSNTDDVLELAPDLHRMALVALQFPKWTDGRAYSQAGLLRGRARFTGDIRALGDVVVDMVPLLVRTGFSSAQLRDGQSIDLARQSLRYFDRYYQRDARQATTVIAGQLDCWFDREAA